MYSKMVTQRKKTASDLGAALNVHTSEASKALRQMLEPYLEDGDSVPDLPKLQRLFQRRLLDLRAQLAEADEVNLAEKRNDQALRQVRDETTLELVDLMSRLRFIVDKSCGKPVCQTLWGLEGTLPRDPVVVQGLAARIVKELRRESGRLPVDPMPGVQLDPLAWVEQLETPLAILEEALFQLSDDKRETLQSRVAKSRLLAEYDRAYQATARILEDFFRYVGQMDMAAVVRTSRRNPAPALPQVPETGEEGLEPGPEGEAPQELATAPATPEAPSTLPEVLKEPQAATTAPEPLKDDPTA